MAKRGGDIELALQMYAEGVMVREIAKAAHIHTRRLYGELYTRGLVMRKTNRRAVSRGPYSERRTHKSGDGDAFEGPTENVVSMQQAYGDDFIRRANRILRGEVDFSV